MVLELKSSEITKLSDGGHGTYRNDPTKCRRILYTKKNRTVETIPPSEHALRQHLKRAMLQSHVWIQCLQLQPDILTATSWGWKPSDLLDNESGIEPLWTNLPQASYDCSELIRCRCKTVCVKRCKCQRFNKHCCFMPL